MAEIHNGLLESQAVLLQAPHMDLLGNSELKKARNTRGEINWLQGEPWKGSFFPERSAGKRPLFPWALQ